MRECADGDSVDACLGDLPHVLESDAARRFERNDAANMLHGGLQLRRGHVVEEDEVGMRGKSFFELGGVSNLDHDSLRHLARADPFDRGADRCGAIDVIVLDQEHVIQADAVILAATTNHRVFIERAKSRRRFSRIENLRSRSRNGVDVTPRCGSDARRALHQVQSCALRAQQRHDRRLHLGHDIARMNAVAVFCAHLELCCGFDRAECRFSERKAGDHARGLDEKTGTAALARFKDGLAGDIGEIFFKSAADDRIDVALIHPLIPAALTLGQRKAAAAEEEDGQRRADIKEIQFASGGAGLSIKRKCSWADDEKQRHRQIDDYEQCGRPGEDAQK